MDKGVTDFYMFFLEPYYKWRTKRDAIRKMQIRPRDEILEKKFDWEQKMLLAEKVENEIDFTKFKYYLDVLKWILKDENINNK